VPNYNPTATETLGIEALPSGEVSQTIVSSGTAVAMKVRSLAAETINQAYLRAKCNVVGYFTLDVYPSSALPEVWTGGSEVTYQLNEDVTVTNITGSPTNSAGNRYTNVDEGTSVYSTTDYIGPTNSNVTTLYEGRVASAGFAGRPLSVTVTEVIELVGPNAITASRHDICLNIGGILFTQTSAASHNVSQPTGPGVFVFSATWNANPATNAPWTVAEIQSFDSTNEIAWRPTATGGLGDFIHPHTSEHLVAMDMKVRYVAETRVATGTYNAGVDTGVDWRTFPLQAIAGGNWSKASATDYTYVLRKSPNASTPSASLGWYGVGLVEPSTTITNFASYAATLTEGIVTALSVQSRWYGIIIRTSAPADSADSQVYAGHTESIVNSTTTETTEFSNAAAKTYGVVTLLVKYTGAVNQSLSVKLKRRSDNVQFGSTITITKAEVDLLPDVGSGWKKWIGQMASAATLAAATQYYWEFTSTATVGSWSIGLFSTGGSGTLSFGTATDRGTLAGVENDAYDLSILLATVPAVPGSFAVALANQTVTTDLSEGTVNTIQYASITWTATSLAGLFSFYEIQRTENAGTTWTTIAEVTTEATAVFKDFEGQRNTLCGYRMRVFRTDGAFSPWSSTVSVTPAKLASDSWSFVTNESNTLNCIFKKEGGVDYVFSSADEVTFHPVFGRDYVVVLQPTEDRGVRFEMSVAMSSLSSYNQGSNLLGWALYNRLRALAEDTTISYVCVHDPYNNRLLAKILVPTGPYPTPNVFWYAVISVTQITNTFSTPASSA
jgi:hypothetical protein